MDRHIYLFSYWGLYLISNTLFLQVLKFWSQLRSRIKSPRNESRPRFVHPYIQKSTDCFPSTHKSYKNVELPVSNNRRFLEPEIMSKLHKKLNGKRVICHLRTIQLQWGIGSTVPLILNLGTEIWCVVKFTPWPLHPWERTPVPIFKRLSGHQNPSGGFREDNNMSPHLAVEHRPAQLGD
jgi:hypothetical protein